MKSHDGRATLDWMGRFIDARCLERELCASALNAAHDTRNMLRSDVEARRQFVLRWLVERGIIADVVALAELVSAALGNHGDSRDQTVV